MRLTASLRAKLAPKPTPIVSQWNADILKHASVIRTHDNGRVDVTVNVPSTIPKTEAAAFKVEAIKVAKGKMLAKDDPRTPEELLESIRDTGALGSHIYFYKHLRSNRMIYSLYRSLNNTKAMKQMTFLGKKTVPAALRKDMWSPFLTASFSNHQTGLKVFQHLRELRRLHETQWDTELYRKSKKKRGEILQDQKANSIADLAAVCERNLAGEEKCRILWSNLYDGEYAEKWPTNVIHDLETRPSGFTAARAVKFGSEVDGSVTPAPENKAETSV